MSGRLRWAILVSHALSGSANVPMRSGFATLKSET
jgi:hypothetical protein